MHSCKVLQHRVRVCDYRQCFFRSNGRISYHQPFLRIIEDGALALYTGRQVALGGFVLRCCCHLRS